MEKDFDNNNENCIEFLSGEHYAVATFTNRKHINRIKNIYTDRKDEFKYLKENKDGINHKSVIIFDCNNSNYFTIIF